MDPRYECRRVLDEIRRLIKRSPFSQRQVEARAGFSRGYLSQLLAENLDLKLVHIIAILEVLEVSPGHFFRTLYPDPRESALARFKSRSQLAASAALNRDLDALYDAGLESLKQLRRRLERCEDAVERLERMGLLSRTGSGGGGPQRP
ncbi:MAG: XRE family transcriptional regulator [Acidobacteria bacterium]|nr:MAG: XRE family transcriptional regulator [Acidobacteriota bacterium]